MISKFLNKPLSEEVISLITEQCTFKGMMKNVQSFTLGDKIEGPKFLCKGVVGNWKEHFTPELNQRFEKEVLAKLKGSGLEFDFELWHTIFCNALMTVFIEMIVFELFIHLFSQKHHLRLEKWRYSHQSVGAGHVAFTNQIALATICFHWLWFRISPVARCINRFWWYDIFPSA